MKTYRIYVTNISQAYSVLTQSEFQVSEGASFVEMTIDPARKMDAITLLNRARVVLYDIEEV